MNFKLKTLFVFLLTLISFYATTSFAELQVFPLRVTLSDKDRSTQISLRHKGNKSERYRITTVFYKMGTDGSMTAIEKTTADDKDGSKYFRYSPRQVTLEPNIEQVVRIMLRAPADLGEGEYRCHLHFEAMNDDETPNNSTGGSSAQMVLKARMAVAIPVIIKKGNTHADVTLDKFKIMKAKDGKYGFSVEMTKKGNGFAYGNIEIVSVSEKGEKQSLATINGISSYIDKRNLTMPLAVNTLPPGKIKILFKEASEAETVLATAETTP